MRSSRTNWWYGVYNVASHQPSAISHQPSAIIHPATGDGASVLAARSPATAAPWPTAATAAWPRYAAAQLIGARGWQRLASRYKVCWGLVRCDGDHRALLTLRRAVPAAGRDAKSLAGPSPYPCGSSAGEIERASVAAKSGDDVVARRARNGTAWHGMAWHGMARPRRAATGPRRARPAPVLSSCESCESRSHERRAVPTKAHGARPWRPPDVSPRAWAQLRSFAAIARAPAPNAPVVGSSSVPNGTEHGLHTAVSPLQGVPRATPSALISRRTDSFCRSHVRCRPSPVSLSRHESLSCSPVKPSLRRHSFTCHYSSPP